MAGNQLIIAGDRNEHLSVSYLEAVGDRPEQQDRFELCLRESAALILICDGMGGYEGGRLAAEKAAETVKNAFQDAAPDQNLLPVVLRAVRAADREVYELKGPDGARLGAGSTLVSVIVQNGTLSWCSVGDSRAYLLRGEEFVQFTKDQNYKAVLDEQLRAHLIEETAYLEESKRGEALISFLGIGDLALIDYNSLPFPLLPGDRLILMSDGLYKLLPDEEIRGTLLKHTAPETALRVLEGKAQKTALEEHLKRDNMTVAIVTIL